MPGAGQSCRARCSASRWPSLAPAGMGEFAFGVLALLLLVSLLIQAAVVGDVRSCAGAYAPRPPPPHLPLRPLPGPDWPHLRCTRSSLPSCHWGSDRAVGKMPPAGEPASRSSSCRCRIWNGFMGDVGLASLVFAVTATILSALVLVLGLGSTTARNAGGAPRDRRRRRRHDRHRKRPLRSQPLSREGDLPSRRPVLGRCCGERPGDTSGRAALGPGDLHTTLFWNRSVQRLVPLDDAASRIRSRRRPQTWTTPGISSAPPVLSWPTRTAPRSSSAMRCDSPPARPRLCGSRAAHHSFSSR